jgi:hypothetical protein
MYKLNLIAIVAIVASVSLFAGMVAAPIFAQDTAKMSQNNMSNAGMAKNTTGMGGNMGMANGTTPTTSMNPMSMSNSSMPMSMSNSSMPMSNATMTLK